ncbi:MAG: LPXTG cell wall anchor domain-containing protein, partial [Lachnospiraceae bacterium]|nr:LPXTG cell wall anchor domain-containing protein [Lachnospiraceae bacterium]
NKTSDETVVKAPKTGNISYMPFAIAMMVISLIGLAGVTVYRRKMENEE